MGELGHLEGYIRMPTLGDDSFVTLTRPDPENMLVMLQTWQSGDCSMQEPYNGDFEKSLSSIKAKTLVLPAKTDLYFP